MNNNNKIRCKKCNFETSEPDKYFYKKKGSKNGYQYNCIKCSREQSFIWANVEKNFIGSIYTKIKNRKNNIRYKKLNDEELKKFSCYVTKEEFIELWEQHKKDRGYTCHLTGIDIFCKVKRTTDDKDFINMTGFSNAVSVDRLDPNVGYTKENIIFIGNEANKNKNAVTKELCEAILKVFKERGL
jgi:hypothetical protein